MSADVQFSTGDNSWFYGKMQNTNPNRSLPPMLPFSIIARPGERWRIDPALASSLREQIALLKAKPVKVVHVRNLKPR